MSKRVLLECLADDDADAEALAEAMEVAYPTAAMAVLRAWRQGLVHRFVDDDTGHYFYRLTDRGAERLAHMRSSNDTNV